MVTVILFIVAAAAWAVMDTYTFHHSESVFKWEPNTSFWSFDSWKRKYKVSIGNQPIKARDTWYTRLTGIKYKERFPLSATLLVAVTDCYHLMQFIMLWSIAGACAIASGGELWWTVVTYRVIWGVVWTVTERLLKRK